MSVDIKPTKPWQQHKYTMQGELSEFASPGVSPGIYHCRSVCPTLRSNDIPSQGLPPHKNALQERLAKDNVIGVNTEVLTSHT